MILSWGCVILTWRIVADTLSPWGQCEAAILAWNEPTHGWHTFLQLQQLSDCQCWFPSWCGGLWVPSTHRGQRSGLAQDRCSLILAEGPIKDLNASYEDNSHFPHGFIWRLLEHYVRLSVFLLSCSLTRIFLFYFICSSCEAASLPVRFKSAHFEVGTLSGSQGGTGAEQRKKDKCFKRKTLRCVHM